MEPKEIIAQIKALLKVDVKLLEATPHPDLISSVMAIKEDCIKYAAEDNELIGLNLARTKLTDQQWQEILDIEKFDPGKLQALNLSGNKLQSIKLSAAFTALKSLEISDNETLVSFSFEAGLPNLGRLTLRDNKLRKLDLPKGFSALKYLDVSRNELQGVDFQGDMPGLVWMELSENKLGKLSLPSGFNSLRYLFCIKSQLKELHFNSPLENLDMLQLRGNELNKMPENFLQLTSLKTLFVHGNPLSTIPPEFIAEGEDDNSLEKIRTYLQSLFEDESIPNDEVKLILLGNSTAGKSSLLRYLRKRKYDDKLPSTHGIFNRIWEIPGKNFKVNVWDFGGQEFYHATHRLFLSNNTVSLIVFEQATTGQMIKPSKIKLYYNGALVEKEIPLEHFPFTYWLDNVQYFCQEVNSDATLLVQSKMDIAGTSKIRISDVDVEKYAINDENMLTVSVEGTSTGQAKFIRSFDDFEEQLLETLEKTKRTYDFSTKWLEIKNELRERGKTQFKFSYKEYIDFCDKIRPDIDKPGEEGTSTMLDLLTDYLHDIGVILYYKEITELKDTVFLNPQKVTDIIYKILDYAVMEEDGKFDIGHVNAVAQGIKKDGIEIEAKDIIALMKQFDLIFPVKNRLGQFVAPQYLPEDIGGGKKAYNRFKEKPNCIHAFTLYYPRFLPRSVISRVICHFGNLSNDDYWKNGILFSKQSTDCLIEAFNDEKIKVELSSESLSLINEIFDKIYQVSGKNAEVQISLDGKSFVAIKKLLTHPFQNPIITATNGEELLYESFIERGILLGNRGKESALFDISKETAIINVQNQSKATKENKTIFFSYAWGVNEASGENREAIVDELYESLEKDGIYELKRDKKDAGYRASIKKFMKDIGKGKLVVVVISDKYLKSPNCMFELLAIFRSAGSDTEEFRERIFPIVLGDANKIYDEIDRLDYVEFWQSKCKKFEEKINKIGLEDARSALPAFDSWIEIKNNVGKIAGILGDLNTLNPKALSVDNFAEIKKSITE